MIQSIESKVKSKIRLGTTLEPLVYHTAIVYRYSGPSVSLLLVLNMRQILGNFFYCHNCHSKSHCENLFRDNKIVSSFSKAAMFNYYCLCYRKWKYYCTHFILTVSNVTDMRLTKNIRHVWRADFLFCFKIVEMMSISHSFLSHNREATFLWQNCIV